MNKLPNSAHQANIYSLSRSYLKALVTLMFLTLSVTAHAQTTALDRTGWGLEASSGDAGQTVAANATDPLESTRWATATKQQPGQTFTIDMLKSYDIDRIVMLTKSDSANNPNNNDHPRAYEVHVSEDGESWGNFVAQGQGSPSGTTVISFPKQSAQHIRITQTGSTDFYWWSIHDLNVFGETSDEVSTSLDRSQWGLSASRNEGNTDKATDIYPDTRWTTIRQPQQPGQTFSIDLKQPIEIDRIQMITSSGQQSQSDYPRGYEVELSIDGQDYGSQPVATGVGSEDGTTNIAFPRQLAQHIRITQTGSDNFFWWSIHDIKVFGFTGIPQENTPPLAQFVAPTPPNNATLDVNANISVKVEASDVDGTVNNVALFIDNQIVSQDQQPPFEWNSGQFSALANLATGTHVLRAEATDNLGAFTSIISTFVLENDNPVSNQAPVTSFDTPLNNTSFERSESIYVNVNASDSDGEIANVKLYIDGQFIRQENVTPYEWNSGRDGKLTNLAVGNYQLRAEATDNEGATTSTEITIEIVEDDGNPTGNQEPTVGFISPTPGNNATLAENQDIQVAVTASDSDGNIANVKLFLNNNLVSQDEQAPYAWNPGDHSILSNLSIGNYQLRAEATDNEGATSSVQRVFEVVDSNPGPVSCVVSGDLRRWHRVSLLCDGPVGDESNEATFTNNRFNVTFSKGSRTLVVPGHFAADGNAADSGATTGNKWRAYFSPPETGTWNYAVSFRTGNNVAVDTNINAGNVVPSINGKTGSFSVAGSGNVTRDMRTRGLLEHRPGESTLRFAGTNDVFIQGGMDSPENIFGYDEFDNTQKFFNRGSCKGILHSFDPHQNDWTSGDPTWKNGKGKSLIGLVNYIASRGANSIYIMMNTVNGDGCDAHPWTTYNSNGDVKSFDVSKLDQWERVLGHMNKKGILIHAMTQETENDGLLNGRNLGLERKLYYRELISRFAHHPALQWNMGEENNSSTAQHKAYLGFIKSVDPYQHPIFLHPKPRKSDREELYAPLLGDPLFDGPSIQTSNIDDSGDMYNEIRDWINRSTQAGNTWVVILAEASGGGAPFPFNNVSSDQRIYWMWASAMSGGGGFEWYLKGQNQGHAYDLAVEDLREFDQYWEQSGHMVSFFRDLVQRDNNVDLERFSVDNNAVSGSNDWVLSESGKAYIVFLREGGNANLNLAGNTNYDVVWFNPRSGQSFDGGVVSANGNLGVPPQQTSQDWAVLLTASSSTLPGNLHPDIVRVLDTPLEEILQTPQGSSWADSYSVGDQCYCETNYDHDIGPVIVETAIGTMTVRQACELIGNGPGSSGRPKYNDVQCGNGPPNNAGDEDYCPGRVDIQGSNDERKLGCNQIGPTWKFNN